MISSICSLCDKELKEVDSISYLSFLLHKECIDNSVVKAIEMIAKNQSFFNKHCLFEFIRKNFNQHILEKDIKNA